jgi:hypothetical protein
MTTESDILSTLGPTAERVKELIEDNERLTREIMELLAKPIPERMAERVTELIKENESIRRVLEADKTVREAQRKELERLRTALELLSEIIFRFKHWDDNGGMILEITWGDPRAGNPAEFARKALESK